MSEHRDQEGRLATWRLRRLVRAMTRQFNAHAIVDQLAAIYDEFVANLRQALARYVEDRTPPGCATRERRAHSPIPSSGSTMPAKLPIAAPARAFARLNQPGTYATSIARPELFRDYLVEQLEHLDRDYDVTISVGRSASEIPYAYVIENSGIQVGDIGTAELSRFFPSNELVHIGDEIADGVWVSAPDQPRPLALFDGPRTDFSLARLRHYTGTPPEHFQQFVLFTNYVRYVDEFVARRDRHAAAEGFAVHRAVGARRGLRARRADRRRGADRRRPVAAAPDAGLSPDGRGPHRASPWSTSASARPTRRRSATMSRCCGPKCG